MTASSALVKVVLVVVLVFCMGCSRTPVIERHDIGLAGVPQDIQAIISEVYPGFSIDRVIMVDKAVKAYAFYGTRHGKAFNRHISYYPKYRSYGVYGEDRPGLFFMIPEEAVRRRDIVIP